MKTVIVHRDEITKEIHGWCSHGIGGEEMNIDNPEFIKFVKKNESLFPDWAHAKLKRNELLKESDWVMFSDVNVSNKEAWLTYRQALRDLPQNFEDPSEVIWPEKPE